MEFGPRQVLSVRGQAAAGPDVPRPGQRWILEALSGRGIRSLFLFQGSSEYDSEASGGGPRLTRSVGPEYSTGTSLECISEA